MTTRSRDSDPPLGESRPSGPGGAPPQEPPPAPSAPVGQPADSGATEARAGTESHFACRIRLFGDVTDQELVGGLHGLAVDAPFGPDRRWVCVDPAVVPLTPTHPILAMASHGIARAASLTYEVRGWSHIAVTDDSILGKTHLSVDVRDSLVTHFHGVLDIVAPSLVTLLERELPAVLNEARLALSQIGLRATSCSARVIVDDTDYPTALDAIGGVCESACAALGRDRSLVLIDDLPIETLLFILMRDHPAADETLWYKYWQSTQAHRQLIAFAGDLAVRAQPIIERVAGISISRTHRRKSMRNTIALRHDLLAVRDELRAFELMAETVRSFRRQLLLEQWMALDPFDGAPWKGRSLADAVTDEELRTYDLPLRRVESAIRSLVDSADMRLRALDAIQQASFNYGVQRQLLGLQWAVVVLTLLALAIGGLSYAAARAQSGVQSVVGDTTQHQSRTSEP